MKVLIIFENRYKNSRMGEIRAVVSALGEEKAGLITAEVKHWLDLSKLFYFAFADIRRFFGPCWFAINIVASHSEEQNTVRHVMTSLQAANAVGTNPISDTTNILEHLREVDYIYLFANDEKEKGAAERKRIKRNDTNGGYFSVDTRIALTDKSLTAAKEYSPNVIETLFRWQARNLVSGRELDAMIAIYEFIAGPYIRCWTEFLEKISNITIPGPGQTPKSIYNEMIASTEYFVLLHTLWAARIRSEDKNGFDVRAIAERCRTTRHLTDAIVESRVLFLHKNGLLEGNGRYRLNEHCLSAFEDYAEKFVGLRLQFKEYLLKRLPYINK